MRNTLAIILLSCLTCFGAATNVSSRVVTIFTTNTTFAAGATQTINGTLSASNVTAVGTFTPPYGFLRAHKLAAYGSTDTQIPRFGILITNTLGSAVTYTTNAANATTITINTAGVYGLSYWANGADSSTFSQYVGWSLNSTELTTSILSVNPTNVLGYCADVNPGAQRAMVQSTVIVPLAVGDVVRPHAAGNVASVSNQCQIMVTKIF